MLRSCEHPASALRFARYLAAREKGLKVFEKYGFVPVADADLWENDDPVITLLAGAMLRPAIEETIRLRKQQDSAPGTISINYNGCGVLVSQMKAWGTPDAFFALRRELTSTSRLEKSEPDGKKINDLFLDRNEVSTNRLVLLVHKDNPKHIKTPARPDAKGMRDRRVGDEHKCHEGDG